MNLAGRSAIITGANQGLGRAIATHYVKSGASVLLVARGEELLQQVAGELRPLARLPGQRVLARKGDVAKPADCQSTVALAARELGNTCILVNNAGIYGPMGRLEEVAWDAWVEAIEVNLFGTVLMCRAFIPHSSPMCARTTTERSSTCPAAVRRRRCRVSVPTPRPRRPWCG
jgi:NAD(P)-dependent dehydrogenase (short-subunit alcohol dehydrogenase family)